MGPTLGFDTKQRNSFLIKFGVFYNKTRFWQYYSFLIMRKSHFNDEFLVLLGPIISRLFTCSNEEKKLKTKGDCSIPISMVLPLCCRRSPTQFTLAAVVRRFPSTTMSYNELSPYNIQRDCAGDNKV